VEIRLTEKLKIIVEIENQTELIEKAINLISLFWVNF
jgi:hypothetical protein